MVYVSRKVIKMYIIFSGKYNLTLNLLTTTIVAPPSNASKWQMGFNSAFKGLNIIGQLAVLGGMDGMDV